MPVRCTYIIDCVQSPTIISVLRTSNTSVIQNEVKNLLKTTRLLETNNHQPLVTNEEEYRSEGSCEHSI